jgi:hypothetical protein
MKTINGCKSLFPAGSCFTFVRIQIIFYRSHKHI